ncbi:MAG: hypothetical protein ACJARL_002810 [Halopseudomonas sp.]
MEVDLGDLVDLDEAEEESVEAFQAGVEVAAARGLGALEHPANKASMTRTARAFTRIGTTGKCYNG